MLSSSNRVLNRPAAETCAILDDLKPNSQNWFVKVLVAEKTPVRSLKWGRQQRFVFVDKEKGSMQCVIYDPDIERLNKVLELYKTYYIGNGRIKEFTTNSPNMGKSAYQMTLNRSAYIRRASEQEELPLDHVYELTPFAECPQYADLTVHRINLLCGVIHVFPPRFIQKNNRMVQDFVIPNDERKPTILTLWEDFVKTEALDLAENIAKMPVVLGMRLSVNTFHGVSVGTLPHSTILFDPPIPQAKQLQLWLNKNKEYVETVITQRLYDKDNQNVAAPHTSQISKIGHILSLDEMVRSFWVKANMKITKSDEHFYFLACPECFKACGASYNNEFTCFYCNKDSPTPKPRLRFEVELFDGTGNLNAFVEQREAETLLCKSGEKIIELEMEGKRLAPENINKRFQDKELFFHIRTSVYEFRGQKNVRNTIIACLSASNEQLTSQISEEIASSSTQANLETDTTIDDTQQCATTTKAASMQTNRGERLPKPTGKRGLDPIIDARYKGQKSTKED